MCVRMHLITERPVETVHISLKSGQTVSPTMQSTHVLKHSQQWGDGLTSSVSSGSLTDLRSRVSEGTLTALWVSTVSFLGRHACGWHVYSHPMFSYLVSHVWQVNQDSLCWVIDYVLLTNNTVCQVQNVPVTMTATNTSLYSVTLPHGKSTESIYSYCLVPVCPSMQAHTCGCTHVPVEAGGQSWALLLRNRPPCAFFYFWGYKLII